MSFLGGVDDLELFLSRCRVMSVASVIRAEMAAAGLALAAATLPLTFALASIEGS
ncbi:hypothetical protein QF034_007577 [Streptomyces africanus]|uniref:Uncharacterized protein n=1 Tax=Streptomyces africanus TaxID=231024 RepID=A0ABU0R109_9ACTN|nr:hypothetical protein [Streptomyces africanus]MDQ0753346.1 hypothetical protein [Streptomyces africanus]